MHKALLIAIGLSLAGGAVSQAQTYGPANPPPPVVRHDVDRDRDHDRDDRYYRDRDDRDHHWRRHHHRRWVCYWRHHHRICHWRHWR